MCLHCCVFHWDYHIRTSSFMAFWVVFVSSKAFFFNLGENYLSCARTTKRAWRQPYPCVALLCPLERNDSLLGRAREHLAGQPQPFKRAVTAVNRGFRETRVVCMGCEALAAPQRSRRGRGLPRSAQLRFSTRRQRVPPSGAGDYCRFS